MHYTNRYDVTVFLADNFRSGLITMNSQTTTASVTYSSPLPSGLPIVVTCTCEGANLRPTISNVTTSGFTIENPAVDEPSELITNLTFHYHAFRSVTT